MSQLRGLVTFQGMLYAIRGNTLLRFDSNGTQTTLGTIGSNGGPIDFAQNLNQLGICDGTALWVYNGASVAQSPNYVSGDRIGVVDQRLVFIQRNTQKFGYSALADMMTIGALDFFSAESVPDNLVSMAVVYGELFMLGEYSGEIWTSIGGLDVFQRNKSAYIEYGCAAAQSLQLAAGSCIWLGRNERGHAAVLQLQGYQAKAISTRAIEERFDGLDLSSARAYVRMEGKRESYYLNVPNVNTTLVYDCAFQQWHEEAEMINGEFEKFRAVCAAFAYGNYYVGASNGTIYQVDPTKHTFAGDVKCRARIAPVISHPSRTRISFPSFELVCEKGTAGTVMLRYSDDNGANYKNWHYKTAGELGQYRTRIKFNRLGTARDRVYEVRMTDDAPFNPVLVNAEVAL